MRPDARGSIRRPALGPAAACLSILAAFALLGAGACAPASVSRSGRRPVESGPCGRSFVFVDHGRPAAVIVLPEGAGETESRAAEILRTSILRMSGVDLPVRTAAEPGGPSVAAIGFPAQALPPVLSSSLPSLRPDGFAVATSAGSLYVVGGGGQGAIYGVVHLLGKYFGCRPFSPTAEAFPRRDDLSLGCIFEVQNPANEIQPR